MKKVLAIAILAWAVFLPLHVKAITGPEPEVRKLADGVYAYIGKVNDANAMFIVTSQGVVVVDTGNTQNDARNILRQIQAVTDQPVRYVILSQNHADHIGGTPLFSPPATVIVHEKVAQAWSEWKPNVVRAWRKFFAERTAALQNFHPLDNVMAFRDHMTLRLGGKTIELIYVDDEYNPGDVAVWLPEESVLLGSMAAYKDRHPDMRPDYSHGTSAGLLKFLEALIALKPRYVIQAHGPIGNTSDLEVMVDYFLTARRRIRGMMDRGISSDAARELFHMNEYPDWDRTMHLPVMAAQLYRELQGEGPEIIVAPEKRLEGRITEVVDGGRYVTVTLDNGEAVSLRVGGLVDIEGVPDRTHFRTGMRARALYEQQKEWNEALEFFVEP
jgi:glyoxylase-like metal-dependent hydrolase (beta-lactamase superfamily II)